MAGLLDYEEMMTNPLTHIGLGLLSNSYAPRGTPTGQIIGQGALQGMQTAGQMGQQFAQQRMRQQQLADLQRQEQARIAQENFAKTIPNYMENGTLNRGKLYAAMMEVPGMTENAIRGYGQMDEAAANREIKKELQTQAETARAIAKQEADDREKALRLQLAQMGIDSRNTIAAMRQGGATTEKPMTEDQRRKFEGRMAKDYEEMLGVQNTLDEFSKAATSVKEAPGLDRAAGWWAYGKSLPNSPAAQAEARIENLKGKVVALGKAAAASSGSIGSIANQEWQILANQVANIDPTKGKDALLEQIDVAERQAKGALDRIRSVYDRQYEGQYERYPQFKLPELPKPPGAGATPPGAKPPTEKTATLADIQETAAKSGRTTAEVTAALKAKGYRIIGGN